MESRAPDLLESDDLPARYGDYTLHSIVAEGGMARIFRASLVRPGGFEKSVAVKVIRTQGKLHDGHPLLVALANEARVGGLVHHHNVVQTYDFGQIGGRPFIALEYVRGTDLKRILWRVGRLPPQLALDVVEQAAAGLHAGHELEDIDVDTEVVHRDIKPENLMVSRDGVVKVLDFGIARAARVTATLTQVGETRGTVEYMSPEQVRGHRDLDRRSDVFSLGAVLFELLVGEALFKGADRMAIMRQIVASESMFGDGGPLRAATEPHLPQVGAVIERCLKQDRNERFDSADELRASLATLRASLPPMDLRGFVRHLPEMAEDGDIRDQRTAVAPALSPNHERPSESDSIPVAGEADESYDPFGRAQPGETRPMPGYPRKE